VRSGDDQRGIWPVSSGSVGVQWQCRPQAGSGGELSARHRVLVVGPDRARGRLPIVDDPCLGREVRVVGMVGVGDDRTWRRQRWFWFVIGRAGCWVAAAARSGQS
jgi:hypothetical protein